MLESSSQTLTCLRGSLRSFIGMAVIALHCAAPAAIARDGGNNAGQGSTASETQVDSLHLLIRPAPELKWHSMFTNIPGDWARFVSSTFRAENIPAIMGITVLTAGLIATDNATWGTSDRWYTMSPPVQSVSDVCVYIGDGRPQFGLAAAFAAWGFVADDHRSLRTGSELVETILACGIVVQTLKHLTGRESPLVSTRPGGRWVFFPNQIEYHKHVPHFDAYPSGHVATALATVTVVTENYPEWVWVKPVGYTMVALLGISMANTGIHWYSDYPLGIVLGYSFGMIAAHPEGLPGGSDSFGSSHLSVSPLIGELGNGVSVSFNF
jgi:hypothetical protein